MPVNRYTPIVFACMAMAITPLALPQATYTYSANRHKCPKIQIKITHLHAK